MIQRIIPSEKSIVIAFPAKEAASSFSCWPMQRLNFAAPPIPHIKAMAVQVITKGKATFVAAFPSIPTLRPMKNWSTILYKALTTIAIILGIAKRRSKFDIFSVPSGFVFCSFIINKTSSFYNIYNIKDCRNDRKWSKRTLSSIV